MLGSFRAVLRFRWDPISPELARVALFALEFVSGKMVGGLRLSTGFAFCSDFRLDEPLSRFLIGRFGAKNGAKLKRVFQMDGNDYFSLKGLLLSLFRP